MRRRIVPAAVALFALGVIALLRRRRRAARAVAHADHAAIPVVTGHPARLPQPQVEPESAATEAPSTPVMETAAPRFLSIPWSTHPDPPPPTATELQIHCTLTSPAMELARVDVRETASQVFVTVLARWRPVAPASPPDPPDAAPPAEARAPDLERTATATLKAPLGDRALVHAPHDDTPRSPHDDAPR